MKMLPFFAWLSAFFFVGLVCTLFAISPCVHLFCACLSFSVLPTVVAGTCLHMTHLGLSHNAVSIGFFLSSTRLSPTRRRGGGCRGPRRCCRPRGVVHRQPGRPAPTPQRRDGAAGTAAQQPPPVPHTAAAAAVAGGAAGRLGTTRWLVVAADAGRGGGGGGAGGGGGGGGGARVDWGVADCTPASCRTPCARHAMAMMAAPHATAASCQPTCLSIMKPRHP